ncbi:5-formyltetrahydrofolate cyclo-ligase [Allomyces macrogynus ATCC 38327]|uniref:5-formyltetrahydrofolate cyclo-ligase n=1 Tax=Allomyces macrogynus (strain ATCC 38327) TaxID=578462 RepID=A0A0L0STA4_ALLM3|nr:5-formyltetrahydrofolate cyclo-ligase [Allomyces macrogynus ATCC 38327]|eukprot:KNE65615.1 5-formyltetrahydrofolate cyclo-ligase [Allomyces macrogynus ATCC 38327]
MTSPTAIATAAITAATTAATAVAPKAAVSAIIEQKRALRKQIRAALTSQPADARIQASRQIAMHLLALPAWQAAHHVAIFLSMGHEVDTAPLVQAAFDQGKRVYVPVITGQAMAMVQLRDQADYATLPKVAWGIPTPSDPESRVHAGLSENEAMLDLVVTPGVAFDRTGRRIGKTNLDTTMRVAVAFADVQLVDKVPTEDHDLRVHVIATDKGVIDCRSSAMASSLA